MVQLGVTENQKEHVDKKPMEEPPSTVVVLPAVTPRAKSTCCTKRVKVAVILVCLIGTLAVLGSLLGFHLLRRYRGRCGVINGVSDQHWEKPMGDWDGYHDGDRDDDRDGDHDDDRDGDHDGDRDGDREGHHDGHHDGGRQVRSRRPRRPPKGLVRPSQ